MAYKLIREEDFNTYTIKHFQCDELSDRATILSDYANPEVPKNALHAGWTATVTTTSSGKTVSFVLANDLSSWAEVAFSKGGDPGSDYFPLLAETEAVMTNDENGDPTAVAYSESATPNTFPIRDDDGEIAVGTPTKSTSAVNKESLEDGTVTVADAIHAQNADFAAQIETDREIEDAAEACPPTVFGTVGGGTEVQNGLMPFTELRGHTIKWNQLVRLSNISEKTENDLTFSVNATTGVITIDGTSSARTTILTIDIPALMNTNGHKCLIRGYEGVSIHAANWNLTNNALKDAIVTSSNSNSQALVIEVLYADISFNNATFYPQIFDLTDIYGAGKEPTTVAEFVRDFPMPYYPYNAGTLLSSKSASVDFVKRNQWDEVWELGNFNTTPSSPSYGQKETSSTNIRSKNYTEVLPNTTYYIQSGSGSGTNGFVLFYDGNKDIIEHYYFSNSGTFQTPSNCHFIMFYVGTAYGTTYLNDICIYINWDTPGLSYVPYSKQHIVLPNIELRSIIGANIYDVAYQTGGGKRRITEYTLTGNESSSNQATGTDYALISIDLPNLKSVGATYKADINSVDFNFSETAWNGNNLVCYHRHNSIYISYDRTQYTDREAFVASLVGKVVQYQMATETDITTTENPGWTEYADIDNFGTVKFNQDPAQDVPVPQAYFIRYTVNLVEFLDSAYVRADGDVENIVVKEDLNGYLERQTRTTTNAQAYIKNGDGTQGMMDIYAGSAQALSLVRRNADGQVIVPTTPTANEHATSKGYVDNRLTATLTQLSDGTYSLTFGV